MLQIKRAILFTLLSIGLISASYSQASTSAQNTNLKVLFNGMKSVHLEVYPADGVDNSISGKRINRKGWNTNEATLAVSAGMVDIQLKQGGSTYIIDNVDCSGSNCVVDAQPTLLTIKFAGLHTVHTDVLTNDSLPEQATGAKVIHSNWKRDETSVIVFPGEYDLRVRKGKSTLILDAIDCTSGPCVADINPATMKINFSGLRSVHSSVWVSDGVAGSVSTDKHTKQDWKNDSAEIVVFPQVFDVTVTTGGTTRIIDAVDCTSGNCIVDASPTQLSVLFEGLNSVHSDIYLSDGVAGTLASKRVTHSHWKNNKADILVQPGVYDIKVRKGKSQLLIEDVNCNGTQCVADVKPATLTVLFDGLKSVHTEILASDSVDGTISDQRFGKSDWKHDRTEVKVFPQVFDLKVRHKASSIILDDIDCRSGNCVADTKPATLTIQFPGIKSVHSDVYLPDGENDIAEGKKVTKAHWKNDLAEIKMLPGIYDIGIRKGKHTLVRDNVDCRSSSCTIDDITATLEVSFPGMTSVHTKVRLPDGAVNLAEGGLVTKADWKSNQTSIPLLRGIFDVKVQHKSVEIFDNIDCTSTTCAIEVTGNAQVTLIDGDTNSTIANANLYIYEKKSNGDLIKKQHTKTSDEGKANFALDGLGVNRIYVVKAYNPYGVGKKYYSPLLTRTGQHTFTITKDGEYPLDVMPPELSIITPTDGNRAASAGFEMTGLVSDNNEIGSMSVEIVDPILGNTQVTPSFSTDGGTWTLQVTPDQISIGQTITINVIAQDRALNDATASISLSIIEDIEGPEIVVNSHADNGTVATSGFLLSGDLIDDSNIASLNVVMTNAETNAQISRSLEVSTSGAWSFAVQSSDINNAVNLSIDLTAIDEIGNSNTKTLALSVVAVDTLAPHMINRITFGATPNLIDEVNQIGALGFLEQQLNPQTIDDSAFNTRLAGFTPTSRSELQQYALLHMIYSRQQLREVMTWFWDNHFNTNINTSREDASGTEHSITVAQELSENQQFRANALGNFRDLLDISARSPAMLIYLDGISNVASDSNENYAREVMELHTLSVDGGYDGNDVAAAAELLTGWTVQNGNTVFNANQHNSSAQTVLGVEVGPGGPGQLDDLLDILSAHPSTAQYICSKLITVLVSDEPIPSLQTRCATAFTTNLNENDQMLSVLRVILTSPEFGGAYRNKIKTPLEFMVGAIRNLEGETDGRDLPNALRNMGLRLFENPVPTGYSEIGSDWINSSLLLERMKWVNQMVRNNVSSNNTYTNPVLFFQSHGHQTAEGIVNYLMPIALNDDFTPSELAQSLDVLNENGPFDINAIDAEQRLRALEGVVLSFPQYQFQ